MSYSVKPFSFLCWPLIYFIIRAAKLEGMMLKLKLQYFGHLMRRGDSLEKTLMLGRIGAGGEGDDRDEMAGCHHRLDERESE